MSDEQALIPIEEREIDFYGDDIIAVLVDVSGEQRVYVPIRPICTYLGLSWSGQRERVIRDPVLSTEMRFVRVTRTNSGGGNPNILCLPLDFLNGWLFGVSATRVKEKHREKVIRYQRECYRILAEAFQLRTAMTPEQSASITVLEQLRDYGLALAQLASDQIEMEKKLAHQGERLDKAALVVGDIVKRLKYVERRVLPGAPITEEQAMVLSQTVKALAELLTEQDRQKKNYHQSIFGELYRRFGITNYKILPIDNFEEAIQFLEDWRMAVQKSQLPPASKEQE